MCRWVCCLCGFTITLHAAALAVDADRLKYLQEPLNPYYVHRGLARIATPQWVGQSEVDAVVILAIDDMRDTSRYEAYLRPILDRLKKIDGRAPVSIMTNQIDPRDQQLQAWLREGVSLEVHTLDHPCPLLQGGDFGKAKQTYDRCVDLMSAVPGSQPVAFRMPCCDSMNTPSPRFWREIFAKTTSAGNFLTLDSSVFNLTTSDDPDLPVDWTEDADGEPRFGKYLPFPSFVNTIKDYPYPYVIGEVCWEFPCMVPSDWEAQNLHRPNNPETVTDLKRALDVVVQKKGVFNLVFHPHGWIRSDQIVSFIDYAVSKYGGRVKFLNFQEAQTLLNRHLLGGSALRDDAGNGTGIRLLDVDDDKYMDVFKPNADQTITTRVWQPDDGAWEEVTQRLPHGRIHFGVLSPTHVASMIAVTDEDLQRFDFKQGRWRQVPIEIDRSALSQTWQNLLRRPAQLDVIRLHDLDGDSVCEIIVASQNESLILSQNGDDRWVPLPFRLPAGVRIPRLGRDTGLRLVDINADGRDDIVFSGGARYSVHLFESSTTGWSRTIVDRARDAAASGSRAIPALVRRDGTNNGAWFHSEHLWIQNEDTDRLSDKVDRMSFDELLGLGESQGDRFPGPTEPDRALRRFRTADGYQVELVAAEPLVVDPVAFDWGPDGRLWVVEMRDYPNGMDGKGQPGGRVKVLNDDDQDGRYDRSTIFLDDLPFPTGVMVWRDGILVTAAPDVLYAQDTDGDDRADVKRVLFRGFGEGNQQHRVNGLFWGLDAWVYLANGDSGGSILSNQTGRELSISGRDLKIRPDEGLMETLSGQTQFGRCRDDFGNWFGGNNSYPMWHYVLEDRYARRNPHFAFPSVRQQVSERPGPAPVFPFSRTLPRFNDFDRVNRITSACSPHIYRDDRFGHANVLQTFVCEPVHNLIHREAMRPRGVTFTSRRLPGEQQGEFLASSDNWFRPVMVRTGPDGALWVADMYRLVIEHPTWIPHHWQQQVDVRGGDDRGRIYRVKHVRSGLRQPPRLDKLNMQQLVEILNQPNGWQRDMAHQLILWRSDRSVIQSLKALLTRFDHPAAPIHALNLLNELGGLDDELLADVILRSDASVARHGMRLAERRLNVNPKLGEAILTRARLADEHLLLQAICSLGQWQAGDQVAAFLAETARAHYGNPFLFPAVMTSLNPDNIQGVVRHTFEQAPDETPVDLMTQIVRQALAMGDRSWLHGVVTAVVDVQREDAVWQLPALATVLDAFERRSLKIQTLPASTTARIGDLIHAAGQVALDSEQEIAQRIAAVQLLRADIGDRNQNRSILAELIEPQQPPELQAAAVTTIVRFFPQEGVPMLLRDWSKRSPRRRSQILDEIMRRPDMVMSLLDHLAKPSSEVRLAARHRQRLLDSSDQGIRNRANEILSSANGSSRQETLKRYAQALAADGQPETGRVVFDRACVTCHRLGGSGHSVGPDLATVTNRSSGALLEAILDPNRAVEEVYYNYVVQTEDGQQFSGIITAETGNSITLTAAESKRHTILRRDIAMLHGTGKSLMPEEMERDLTPADIKHVIAYLRSHRPPHKQFSGNQPQLAPMRDDGSIRLFAIHAQIYGPSLVFEPGYRNLGFWSQVNDHAIWQVELKEAGQYRVTLDYACADQCAGNRFVLSAGQQQLSGTVSGTGTWDNYRGADIGRLQLPAGKSEILFRSDGPIRSFLIDLRTIILRPVD